MTGAEVKMKTTTPLYTISVLLMSICAATGQGTNATLDSTGSCTEDSLCYFQVADTPFLYGWESYEEGVSRMSHAGLTSSTRTATIITMIDTVLDITSTVTSGSDLPSVNAAGTRTEIITYTKMGATMSTTLTFPSYFMSWPDEYYWYGTYEATDKAGSKTCNIATTSSTFWIASNPQPTAPSVLSRLDGYWNKLPISDPRGLGYSFRASILHTFREFSDVLSDQPIVTSCIYNVPGPNWGGFTQTFWVSVHSTISTTGLTPPPTALPVQAPTQVQGGVVPSTSPAAPPGSGGNSGSGAGTGSGSGNGSGSGSGNGSGNGSGPPGSGPNGSGGGAPGGGSGGSSGPGANGGSGSSNSGSGGGQSNNGGGGNSGGRPKDGAGPNATTGAGASGLPAVQGQPGKQGSNAATTAGKAGQGSKPQDQGSTAGSDDQGPATPTDSPSAARRIEMDYLSVLSRVLISLLAAVWAT